MTDLTGGSQSRQSFNSSSFTTMTKIRPGNVRLGRSQSQADLPFSSKFSSSRQQRSTVNDSIDFGVSSSSPPALNPTPNGGPPMPVLIDLT